MALQFKKATKKQARLRMAFIGPAGGGKTFSSLSVAKHLGGRVAVIDTEHGSASKYADEFDFDSLELESFGPETYVEAIKAAEKEGYDVIVIDSLSHAWMGKDGALEQVNEASKRSQSSNSYVAWRNVTPKHNSLVDAIVGSRCHIIATMRSKTEYVQEKDERGKTVIRKVGLAPIQRDGMEFEFDVVGDMTQENEYIVTKSRCSKLTNKTFSKPGENIALVLRDWLGSGEAVQEESGGHLELAARYEDEASRCASAADFADLKKEWGPKFKDAPKDIRTRLGELNKSIESKLAQTAA